MVAGKKQADVKAGTAIQLMSLMPKLDKELSLAGRTDAICKLSKFALPAIAPVPTIQIERKENPSNNMFAFALNQTKLDRIF